MVPPRVQSGRRTSAQTLVEMDRDLVADGLVDLAEQGLGERQLVGAVTERHEGGADRMTVDGAADLHQACGAEELGGPVQLDIGPASRVRALQDDRGEGLVEPAWT